MRIGELFSGYGGLGQGVQQVLGGEIAWHSEIDPGASKILAHRYPDVPNLGDITTIDWTQVEPVDVITGGSPCQDVSAAGKRAGMRAGTRSGLWASMCDAIEIIRPGLVVWENVRGALSAGADSSVEPCPICVGDERDTHLRALGRVVGDLSELGYVGRWVGLRASDVGAPHGRFRIFVAAWPACNTPDHYSHRGADLGATGGREGFSPADTDGEGLERPRASRLEPERPEPFSSPGIVADAADDGRTRSRPSRAGWNGSTDHGHTTAHPEGDGRDEGWAEPAWIVGGSDNALSGDQTVCATCGDPVEYHDADGFCAGLCGGNCQDPYFGRPGIWNTDDGTPTACSDNWTGPRCGETTREEIADGIWCACERPAAADADNAADDGERARPEPRQGGSIATHPDSDAVREQSVPVAWRNGAALAGHAGTDAATDAIGGGCARRTSEPIGFEVVGATPAGRGESAGNWGPYAAAIHRWERVLGRLAPPPTELSAKGSPRLSPAFVEWMMGLPAGWVTDVPGLTRNDQLKALGNGVVPQQCAEALRRLLHTVSSPQLDGSAE